MKGHVKRKLLPCGLPIFVTPQLPRGESLEVLLNLRIPETAGAPTGTLYADSNGDGQHQDSEPSVTQTAQIDQRGGQFLLLMRVEIPRSTADRQQYAYNVVATSVGTNRAASEASTVLLITVRLRSDFAADGTITTSHTWVYQDTNGNSYQN
jgi:hypothetical protein